MNIMRNAFKRANYVLCLLLALSGTSCINRLNDEIKEGSILISFSFEASKAATKVTKNTFDIGDRSGIFAMLTGNSLDQQRYIDNLLLECSDNSKLISKKEVYLKSATKLFSVLLASKRPLITELADKLRLKYPLLPTISPCPTMRLEAIRSIIPISCRRYPKSV